MSMHFLPSRSPESVRAGFRECLPVAAHLEPRLRALVDDVLDHPGSLLRARLAHELVLRFADPATGFDGAAGSNKTAEGGLSRTARDTAIAIEYFHTASLLLDDLPAMDDAGERRGRPCPHRVYGESSAILGALALINRAYGLLWGVLAGLPPERSKRAAELVEGCLGLAGILDGQARDLGFAASRRRPADVLAVAEGKTVTLIRLGLLLPALVAGVGEEERRLLGELSRAWGLAYQVQDDFRDLLPDGSSSGKTSQRDRLLGRPNLPLAEGPERARARLEAMLAEGGERVARLCAIDRRWDFLDSVQSVLESEWQGLAVELEEHLVTHGAPSMPGSTPEARLEEVA